LLVRVGRGGVDLPHLCWRGCLHREEARLHSLCFFLGEVFCVLFSKKCCVLRGIFEMKTEKCFLWGIIWNLDWITMSEKCFQRLNSEKHFLKSVTKYSVKTLSNWAMQHEQFPSLFTYQVSIICFLLKRL
jgi:hypothetical protein